ncbi:mediator of RNA polymerase II transcription subunit 33A-like [Cynara cardunculus var. scolymus]|uniref:mediator of RNA polymerase II transcription subunit 33A-like n=1 Tax=Cynara cardunculus var. scolymus TaxID=59895 RepID=UPI000D62E436|nr:mediator of RNA polymerase II transcription subunit 33A-like [Cynara cardunculus var. scolymus]
MAVTMAVTIPVSTNMWDGVMEMIKSAQNKGVDPLMWAVELSSTLLSAGVSMPSTEVAELLVSHICWSNNVPIAWKFLEKALSIRIVPPMLVLALLSNRVIPSRRSYPAAYRLYLELLKRHIFPLASEVNGSNYHKIMESIDQALNLHQIFGFQSSEPGILLVEFIFSVVWELLDASLDDENLLELVPEKKSIWPIKSQDMEINDHNNFGEQKIDFHQGLYKSNTTMSIEIIGELFRNKVTSRILHLARRNMPVHWGSFIQHLRLLVANSTALRNSKDITPEALLQLTSDSRVLLSRECKTISLQQFHAVMACGSLISSAGQSHGASRSATWLPIDLFLEDTMDGYVVATTSAAETLTGLLKAHQAITQASWQDALLGLWIAALRLVQREDEAVEGPVPRLDTCLCLLLCTTTLAVANIIEEEENALLEEDDHKRVHQGSEAQVLGNCRKSLVSSLQQLGDYEGLLTPPLSVTSIANQAAAKAIMFFSGISVGSGYLDGVSLNDMPVTCAGNMRHLIVEACIARNLLDTSAYLWPGYVKGHSNQIPRTISGQMPGWSSLMKGSSLTPSMMHTLVSTPASSLAEIEKIYGIATTGSDEEKISAATVLCGASLTRGWNIQEHTGYFIIKLLAPPVPVDYSGSESHLIVYAPLLNVLLVGISSIDCVQIFSLHGLAPHLAGVLMPICEVFGSCSPTVSCTLSTGERLCPLAVFSNAFTLLLKLWRFHQPALEHVLGDVTPVGSQLTPEFLLLARNSQLASRGNSLDQKTRRGHFRRCNLSSSEPIFLDSFPKLTFWYRQHQACIASTLSDLKPGTSVYQIFDALLNMMFRKMNRGGQSLTPTTSGSSSSSGPIPEDCTLRLKLPAWDILEAVPFVLDAALTACAHGRLSPRELTTGLKDLADFLPASMATIVSYLSAETTRGLWKPASMNGTDWPSPATSLAMVEKNMNKILSATGVDVPSLSAGGTTQATLPLPLAALVSLTITYKVDRDSESVLNLAAPALNALGAGCPWPCMAIISALWVQKAKRWTDYLVFSASRTVFHHNSDAVVQLLRVCFQSTVGLASPFAVATGGGVGSLLGHGFGSHCSGGIAPVAPGILYLRVHRSVRDVMFMTEEIVTVLMHTVREIVSTHLPMEKMRRAKNGMALRYGEVSLSAAMTRIKLAASLGASIVWITGRLNLIQSLIKETLPSWFISGHKSDLSKGETGGMVGMLMGYALAYFAVLSGAFAWGVDAASSASKKRPFILGAHLEFMARALDGKISLGCNKATWRAYVSGFVSLMVSCAPKWASEVDVEVLKSLSKGLRKWDEEELALALLGISGVNAMGAAAEMIIESLV